MDYNIFVSKVRKLNKPKIHKITNSYGVYDAYKWIRKNHWLNIGKPLTENQFYTIIRTINKEFGHLLAKGEDIKLPKQMGSLEIRKTPTKVTIENGKLKTNYPIDWNATTKLWYEDTEAFKKKSLIRREVPELYAVYYNKWNAKYNNKYFYEFFPNRNIKKELIKNVLNNQIEAFLYHG